MYDRRVDDWTLTFGVSGKLADDDLGIYDRETGSEWKQSLGLCIAGALEGTRVTVRPAAMTTWEAFREEYPDDLVLQPAETKSKVASDGHSGRTWTRDDFEPKTVVLGVESDGEAVGFPLPCVREAGGVVQTTVGTTAVVAFATDGELHAFENPGYEFREDGGAFVADGTAWDESTGRAGDGRQLERFSARRLFAWQDDHGPDAFFEA